MVQMFITEIYIRNYGSRYSSETQATMECQSSYVNSCVSAFKILTNFQQPATDLYKDMRTIFIPLLFIRGAGTGLKSDSFCMR